MRSFSGLVPSLNASGVSPPTEVPGLRSTRAVLSTLVANATESLVLLSFASLDDLGLHRLSAQQSIDLYELVIGRHRSSSFVITSNRAVEEWLGLFDDPILGNSALDRLANASYQIVIEGESYRQRLSPHRALLEGPQGGDAVHHK